MIGHYRLGPIRRGIREVGLAMIAGGAVVLLFVGYQLYGTTLSEQRAQTSLSHAFGADRAHGGAPAATAAPTDRPGGDAPTITPPAATATDLSPTTPVGSAIEHLVIPKIGLDRYVVQGTDEADLMKGPGHYVGTPFPGQKGNAAIAGHRTTYGAPFFRLDELTDGDRIEVTNTKGRTFVFSVIRHLIVAPSGTGAAAVLADTPAAELTLTTCNPRFEATNRLVVVAALIGAPAAAAAASPTLATGTPTAGPRRSSTAPPWCSSGRQHAWP
jgi:sortase A